MPLPAKELPERKRFRWDVDYWARLYGNQDDSFPNILYRLHYPPKSEVAHTDALGFTAAGRLPNLETASLRKAIVNHCTVWQRHGAGTREQSPFVSLTSLFTYCVWEAARRSLTLSDDFEQHEIWFIDAAELRKHRPPNKQLWHPLDLLLTAPEHETRQELEQEAVNFANLFDEFVVLHNIPSQSIMGHISMKDLLPMLPVHFLQEEYRSFSNPSRRTPSHLFYTWKGSDLYRARSLRSTLEGISLHLPHSITLDNVFLEADTALRIAVLSCKEIKRRGRHVSQCISIIALGIANAVIDWASWDNTPEARSVLAGLQSSTLISAFVACRTRVEVDTDRRRAYWIGDLEKEDKKTSGRVGSQIQQEQDALRGSSRPCDLFGIASAKRILLLS